MSLRGLAEGWDWISVFPGPWDQTQVLRGAALQTRGDPDVWSRTWEVHPCESWFGWGSIMKEGLKKAFGHQHWANWASLVVQMVKNLVFDARDPGSISELGRSPGEGNGNPLQYSSLENSMDRGAWWATVHRVAKSQTLLKWLSTHTV